MRATLATLSDGGGLDALVLDLRDNGGGLLQSAVDVASLFLPEGALIAKVRVREYMRAGKRREMRAHAHRVKENERGRAVEGESNGMFGSQLRMIIWRCS